MEGREGRGVVESERWDGSIGWRLDANELKENEQVLGTTHKILRDAW